jgi:5-methylcytosine-specific restriction endonuclease McrA
MQSIKPELIYNPAKRLATVKFLGGKCQKCGTHENLHIHHKWRRKWDNRILNLNLLCSDCHKKRHRSKILSGEWKKQLQKFKERFEKDPVFRMKVKQKVRELITQTKLEDYLS